MGGMTVVEGRVLKEGIPAEGIYVRLVGPSGDFLAERRTRASGSFRFHLPEGTWTHKWLGPGGIKGSKHFELSGEKSK
jgi:hypothetical protein